MNASYEVGFKDVYPWVWSVMLGVALTVADRRGVFLAAGTRRGRDFWTKNLAAVAINVGAPAILFGLTMVRLGPRYPQSLDFWQILGVLYLAGSPLGAHHIWVSLATRCGWMPVDAFQEDERKTVRRFSPKGSLIWAVVAFVVPALAAILGWRLPF